MPEGGGFAPRFMAPILRSRATKIALAHSRQSALFATVLGQVTATRPYHLLEKAQNSPPLPYANK